MINKQQIINKVFEGLDLDNTDFHIQKQSCNKVLQKYQYDRLRTKMEMLSTGNFIAKTPFWGYSEAQPQYIKYRQNSSSEDWFMSFNIRNNNIMDMFFKKHSDVTFLFELFDYWNAEISNYIGQLEFQKFCQDNLLNLNFEYSQKYPEFKRIYNISFIKFVYIKSPDELEIFLQFCDKLLDLINEKIKQLGIASI